MENIILHELCRLHEGGEISEAQLQVLIEMHNAGTFIDLLELVQSYMITVLNDELGVALSEFRGLKCRHALPDIVHKLTMIACK